MCSIGHHLGFCRAIWHPKPRTPQSQSREAPNTGTVWLKTWLRTYGTKITGEERDGILSITIPTSMVSLPAALHACFCVMNLYGKPFSITSLKASHRNGLDQNPRHCRRVETQTLQETQWFQVVSAKEQTTKSPNRRAMNEPSLPAPFLKRQTLVDAEPTSPAELLQAYIARASWWTKAGHLCQVKIVCLRVRVLGHLILRLPIKGVGFKRSPPSTLKPVANDS